MRKLKIGITGVLLAAVLTACGSAGESRQEEATAAMAEDEAEMQR